MSKTSFKHLTAKSFSPAKLKTLYEVEDIKIKMQQEVMASNESLLVKASFKVLIVSDSKKSQGLMLHSIKQQLGFPYVKIANNVQEATKLLKEQPFDIVLSSYRMSEGDGDALYKFTQGMLSVPYFIMTMDFTEYEASNLREAGILTLPAQYSPEHLELTFKAVYTKFIDSKLNKIAQGEELILV